MSTLTGYGVTFSLPAETYANNLHSRLEAISGRVIDVLPAKYGWFNVAVRGSVTSAEVSLYQAEAEIVQAKCLEEM